VTSLSKKDGDLSDDSFFFVFSLMGIHESSTNSGEPCEYEITWFWHYILMIIINLNHHGSRKI